MRRRRGRFDPTGVGARLHRLATTGALAEMSMVDVSQLMQEQLENQTLPSWCRITLDKRFGGFRFGTWETTDPRRHGKSRGTAKQVVSQCRMIWNLAWGHRHAINPRDYDPLARARDGYRFLQRRLRDAEHGGYYWSVTRSGEIENDLKVLYGQGFVIFALVELSRANGERGPLDDALALWQVVMDRLHDGEHGGWAEHAQRDWRPPPAARPVPIEQLGHKSADAHLHWMEALTELCTETGDPSVATSLGEVVDLLCTHFYPPNPEHARTILTRDWQPLKGATELRISLGHNVEFARLLLAAEHALGRPRSTDRFVSYLDHALDSGFDHAHGGLDTHPSRSDASTSGTRIWWVQAELLATLAEAVTHECGHRYDDQLRQHLAFVLGHQADPCDGLWWEEVDGSGLVTKPLKYHEWKAGYHELRAITCLIESSALPTSD